MEVPLAGSLFTLAVGGFLVGPAGLAGACGAGGGAATDFSFTSPAFFDPASWILSAHSFIYERERERERERDEKELTSGHNKKKSV